MWRWAAVAVLVAGCSGGGGGEGRFATGTVVFTLDEARPFVEDWGALELGLEYRTLVVDADADGQQCGFEVFSQRDGGHIHWTVVDPAAGVDGAGEFVDAVANVAGRWEMTGRVTRQRGNDGLRAVFQPDASDAQLIFEGRPSGPADPCRLDR